MESASSVFLLTIAQLFGSWGVFFSFDLRWGPTLFKGRYVEVADGGVMEKGGGRDKLGVYMEKSVCGGWASWIAA